ncbi:MAG: S-methyl-5-thioribose kinase [Chloroflexi bacterium HGW-Chloroflexi-6]|nr:MAG: S-methyl-5-thioribose kinase [Chloroflexi bacterium HGW-Chloroflexi-6]
MKLLFDIKEVKEYIESINQKLHIFKQDFYIEEILGGFINKIYLIKDQNGSIILKQTWPYFYTSGPSWPLSLARFSVEVTCLLKFNDIAPGFSPRVIYRDYSNKIILMEYLLNYKSIDNFIDNYFTIPQLAEQLAYFLAHITFHTSDFSISSTSKKVLAKKLINPSIVSISENLVFSDPFIRNEKPLSKSYLDDERNAILCDPEIKYELAILKNRFINYPQSLLHGDLHQGSILSNGTNIKIIDPEFGFLGPIGYDLGLVLSTLITSFVSLSEESPNTPSMKVYFRNTIKDFWFNYKKIFLELWEKDTTGHMFNQAYWDFEGGNEKFTCYKNDYMIQILQDSCGYAGSRILAGTIGSITFPCIEKISGSNNKKNVEIRAINIGKKLVLKRKNINEVSTILDLITETD